MRPYFKFRAMRRYQRNLVPKCDLLKSRHLFSPLNYSYAIFNFDFFFEILSFNLNLSRYTICYRNLNLGDI